MTYLDYRGLEDKNQQKREEKKERGLDVREKGEEKTDSKVSKSFFF